MQHLIDNFSGFKSYNIGLIRDSYNTEFSVYSDALLIKLALSNLFHRSTLPNVVHERFYDNTRVYTPSNVYSEKNNSYEDYNTMIAIALNLLDSNQSYYKLILAIVPSEDPNCKYITANMYKLYELDLDLMEMAKTEYWHPVDLSERMAEQIYNNMLYTKGISTHKYNLYDGSRKELERVRSCRINGGKVMVDSALWKIYHPDCYRSMINCYYKRYTKPGDEYNWMDMFIKDKIGEPKLFECIGYYGIVNDGVKYTKADEEVSDWIGTKFLNQAESYMYRNKSRPIDIWGTFGHDEGDKVRVVTYDLPFMIKKYDQVDSLIACLQTACNYANYMVEDSQGSVGFVDPVHFEYNPERYGRSEFNYLSTKTDNETQRDEEARKIFKEKEVAKVTKLANDQIMKYQNALNNGIDDPYLQTRANVAHSVLESVERLNKNFDNPTYMYSNMMRRQIDTSLQKSHELLTEYDTYRDDQWIHGEDSSLFSVIRIYCTTKTNDRGQFDNSYISLVTDIFMGIVGQYEEQFEPNEIYSLVNKFIPIDKTISVIRNFFDRKVTLENTKNLAIDTTVNSYNYLKNDAYDDIRNGVQNIKTEFNNKKNDINEFKDYFLTRYTSMYDHINTDTDRKQAEDSRRLRMETDQQDQTLTPLPYSLASKLSGHRYVPPEITQRNQLEPESQPIPNYEYKSNTRPTMNRRDYSIQSVHLKNDWPLNNE